MLATIMYRAGDVRVENVPDAKLVNPTDALVRITRACICGSDLWPYHDMEPSEKGRPMGHEAIGVVEAVGKEVRKLKKGDFVVMPFAFSDGQCPFCHEGLTTSCVHGGFFGFTEGVGGAQAEAIRIPLADGTLYPLPVREDHALVASLLTLSDVREPVIMRPSPPASVPEKPLPWLAMALSACAVSLPPNDLARNKSFCLAAISLELRSQRNLVQRTS